MKKEKEKRKQNRREWNAWNQVESSNSKKRERERERREYTDRPSVLSRIEINYHRAIAGSSERDSTNIFVAHSITTIHDEVRYIAVEKFSHEWSQFIEWLVTVCSSRPSFFFLIFLRSLSPSAFSLLPWFAFSVPLRPRCSLSLQCDIDADATNIVFWLFWTE